MVYTVFYKTSSFAGYCFLGKNSIHPKRYGVFSFKAYKVILVKIQICSFIDINYIYITIIHYMSQHLFLLHIILYLKVISFEKKDYFLSYISNNITFP